MNRQPGAGALQVVAAADINSQEGKKARRSGDD